VEVRQPVESEPSCFHHLKEKTFDLECPQVGLGETDLLSDIGLGVSAMGADNQRSSRPDHAACRGLGRCFFRNWRNSMKLLVYVRSGLQVRVSYASPALDTKNLPPGRLAVDSTGREG
jgi:hypothetical protein